MKIAILGTRGYPYVYSGYETFVSELSPRLIRKGHRVTVYCHRGLFRERPASMNGVDLVYVPAIEQKILSQFTHSFLSTLHAIATPADVLLYVNSSNGPFGMLTSLAGKKTAINVDGIEWLRPKWKGLGARYFRFASYLSTKFFDAVITDSDRMADIYREEFASDSTTIAYGADLGYARDPGPLAQWDLTPGEYYLVVGRLIPDNNADLVVQGYARSRSRKKLVVLGDVPYRDAYADGVKAIGDPRILFPGYVRDSSILRELYCNAFAYIHGHEFGGTNPSLLKALAYGCAVLALDTPFSREVLADDAHGLYFQKSPDALVRALERLETSSGLAGELRAKARARITEKYTWELIADQYETLLNKIVSVETTTP
jgi:glycosyltransferase involved in cell wall biosynthesis